MQEEKRRVPIKMELEQTHIHTYTRGEEGWNSVIFSMAQLFLLTQERVRKRGARDSSLDCWICVPETCTVSPCKSSRDCFQVTLKVAILALQWGESHGADWNQGSSLMPVHLKCPQCFRRTLLTEGLILKSVRRNTVCRLTHRHRVSVSVYTVSKPVQTRCACSLSPPHLLEEDKLAEESAKGIDLDHCGCLNSRYTISAKGPWPSWRAHNGLQPASTGRARRTSFELNV